MHAPGRLYRKWLCFALCFTRLFGGWIRSICVPSIVSGGVFCPLLRHHLENHRFYATLGADKQEEGSRRRWRAWPSFVRPSVLLRPTSSYSSSWLQRLLGSLKDSTLLKCEFCIVDLSNEFVELHLLTTLVNKKGIGRREWVSFRETIGDPLPFHLECEGVSRSILVLMRALAARHLLQGSSQCVISVSALQRVEKGVSTKMAALVTWGVSEFN